MFLESNVEEHLEGNGLIVFEIHQHHSDADSGVFAQVDFAWCVWGQSKFDTKALNCCVLAILVDIAIGVSALVPFVAAGESKANHAEALKVKALGGRKQFWDEFTTIFTNRRPQAEFK